MMIIAYLDPGTGAMVIQALIAGVVGVGFAVKLFWTNIKGFFLKLAGKEVESCDPPGSCDSSDATEKNNDR
jgi:hypothetical protein